MQIAYLILAHKNPEQLRRLVNKLSTDKTSFYIHIDAKVENTGLFFNYLSGFSKVQYIQKRVKVNWGAFSMVEATLNGLEEIVNTGHNYDYVTLMSGQDYPIKSNYYIDQYYSKHRGREFINYKNFPDGDLPQGGMDRIDYYYDYDNSFSACYSADADIFEKAMRERKAKRKFIPGMVPYSGSQWWSLTLECIKYIINLVNANYEIINFYRYSKFSDEQFFQTVVMNSPFSSGVLNDSIWYIDWSGNNWDAIDWKTAVPHPKILDTSDFSKLAISEKLYARKFDMVKDKNIIDLIDHTITK